MSVETAELSLAEHAASGDPTPTVVYILEGRPDGAVKVGITQHPRLRIRQIQRGMREVYRTPITLRDFYVLPTRATALRVEADTHRLLSNRHTGVGEWFFCTADEASDAILIALGAPA